MSFKPRQGDEIHISSHPKLRDYNYQELTGVVKGYIKKRREVVVEFENFPGTVVFGLDRGTFRIRRKR